MAWSLYAALVLMLRGSHAFTTSRMTARSRAPTLTSPARPRAGATRSQRTESSAATDYLTSLESDGGALAVDVSAAAAVERCDADDASAPAAAPAAVETCDAIICGGGPAGLAAAIELRRRGLDKVVAVERRSAPDEFEDSKAYLYLVDVRGQRWTDTVPGLTEAIADIGVSNAEYRLNVAEPDERGVCARRGRIRVALTPRLRRGSSAGHA